MYMYCVVDRPAQSRNRGEFQNFDARHGAGIEALHFGISGLRSAKCTYLTCGGRVTCSRDIPSLTMTRLPRNALGFRRSEQTDYHLIRSKTASQTRPLYSVDRPASDYTVRAEDGGA
jgi:hypothetical protein